jgi:hypothetical protein
MDMKLHDSDREWEKEAPTLSAMEKVNPFTVPSKYFDSLSETLHSISLIESVRFENEEKFSFPKGYFKELEKHIKTKAALENSQNLPKTIGFRTPEDYFSDLTQKIEAKIKVTDHTLMPIQVNQDQQKQEDDFTPFPFQIYQDQQERLWFVGFKGAYRLENNAFVNVTRNGPW